MQGETQRGHRYNTGRVTGRDGYDEAAFEVRVSGPEGTSLEAMDRAMRAVEASALRARA